MTGPDAAEEQTHPWRAFVAEASGRLASAGFESADIDARRIVEAASGFEGADYHLCLDQPATVRGVAHFDAMVQRRLKGEPLQYVVGSWGFRQLDLLVDHRVLIPRPETEVVAGVAIGALAHMQSEPGATLLVADLGTGSGAIGLSVAVEVAAAQVILTDSSPDALAVARANLAGIGRAATRVQAHAGSWFQALPEDLAGSFDLIVSNPPYVGDGEELPPVVSQWEPAAALRAGPDGTDDLHHLVDGAHRWLRPGGVLVLEMAPNQTAAIAGRAGAAGFTDIHVMADLTQRDRLVKATWPN